MSNLITMENIQKIFYSEDLETHALSNINLCIESGEYIAITGPSGCGKSTLLSLLGLLDTPSTGTYVLNGQNVTTLSNSDRARYRNQQIGFVFQSFNLISDMSVFENVELPLTYRSELNKKQIAAMVNSALKDVNMEHRANHYPAQLSGGQQQRVAIARAIVGKPSFILADEPTGNLDSVNAATVMELFHQLHARGTTICIVTHDPRSAEKATRTISLKDGQVLRDDVKSAVKPLLTTVSEG